VKIAPSWIVSLLVGMFLGCLFTIYVGGKEARKIEYRTRVVTQRITKTVTLEHDKLKIVTRTLVRKVPVYVTKETDRRFAVPVGLVRLLDAASRNKFPGTPGAIDGSASDVAISEVARVGVTNYGMCQKWRYDLLALQGWVREEQAAVKGSANAR
jgi:hypothetical protein